MVLVFTDWTFQKQGDQVTHMQQGHFMDTMLKHNVDNFILRGVERKFDAIILVTGLEGTGKSTFTQSLAAYCGAWFHQPLLLKNIVFTGRELVKAIDEAEVGTPIIFDEAIMDMASQDSATEMQKILIKKFTLIRKKRLIIFLVIPSIFMLRKYFAIFRTRVMINCYCPDGITRGSFRAYSFKRKKELYLHGYKDMNMGAVKPNFHGHFSDTSGFFVDVDAYEAKKDAAIKELTEDSKNKIEEQFKQTVEDIKIKARVTIEKNRTKYKEKISKIILDVRDKIKANNRKITRRHQAEVNPLYEDFSKVLFMAGKAEIEKASVLLRQDLNMNDFIRIVNNTYKLSMPMTELKKHYNTGKKLIEMG